MPWPCRREGDADAAAGQRRGLLKMGSVYGERKLFWNSRGGGPRELRQQVDIAVWLPPFFLLS